MVNQISFFCQWMLLLKRTEATNLPPCWNMLKSASSMQWEMCCVFFSLEYWDWGTFLGIEWVIWISPFLTMTLVRNGDIFSWLSPFGLQHPGKQLRGSAQSLVSWISWPIFFNGGLHRFTKSWGYRQSSSTFPKALKPLFEPAIGVPPWLESSSHGTAMGSSTDAACTTRS